MSDFVDAVVEQLDGAGSIVIRCSACTQCKTNNPDYKPWSTKKCLLSVQDHGTRCHAYPEDQHVFLIDSDQSKIKQLPNV